jgi:hypothetical protein
VSLADYDVTEPSALKEKRGKIEKRSGKDLEKIENLSLFPCA